MNNSSDYLMHQLQLQLLQRRRPLYAIAVPSLLAACTSATAINGFVLISTRKIPAIKMQPTLILTLSLAASDTWLTVVVGLGLLFNSYLPIVYDFHLPKHSCFAFFLEAVRLGSIACSVLHLAALAYSQLKTCKSTTCSTNLVSLERSNFKCKSAIACLWTFPTVCFLLIFGSIRGEGFLSENCMIGPIFAGIKFRIIVVSVMIIPLPIMLFAYISTFLYVQSRKRTVRGESLLQRLSRTLGTIITMALILVSFIISMIPSFLLYLLVCDTGCPFMFRDIGFNSFFALNTWANLMIILKSIMNPFLYATRIPEIRRCFGVRVCSATFTELRAIRWAAPRLNSTYQAVNGASRPSRDSEARATLVNNEPTQPSQRASICTLQQRMAMTHHGKPSANMAAKRVRPLEQRRYSGGTIDLHD